MTQKGCFVIADITGYTAFLTASELEHAQDILNTLFHALLDNIKPPLVVSNFQGDAILTYTPPGSFFQGQTLLEALENLYYAFMQTRETVHMNTTCTCNACANVRNLDLKLFVHHGEYLLQSMGGRQELSGPDVIIAHRMMKNSVKEKTGVRAYALITQAAVDALDFRAIGDTMTPHSEEYEHIGAVPMRVYDLGAVWERERQRRRIVVQPEGAWIHVQHDLPAPPAVIWDFLTMADFKIRWAQLTGLNIIGQQNGRNGIGTMHHCAHGKELRVFTIVDWRPFEYITMEIALPFGIQSGYTTYLKPTPQGTQMVTCVRQPQPPNVLSKIALKLLIEPKVRPAIRGEIEQAGPIMRQMIAELEAAHP